MEDEFGEDIYQPDIGGDDHPLEEEKPQTKESQEEAEDMGISDLSVIEKPQGPSSASHEEEDLSKSVPKQKLSVYEDVNVSGANYEYEYSGDENEEESEGDGNGEEEGENVEIILDTTEAEKNKDQFSSQQINTSQHHSAAARSSKILTMLPGYGTKEGGLTGNEVDPTTFEEKPWRKPGVDISDYFNYGFNEESWQIYCGKQVQLRMEQSMHQKIKVFESTKKTHPPNPPSYDYQNIPSTLMNEIQSIHEQRKFPPNFKHPHNKQFPFPPSNTSNTIELVGNSTHNPNVIELVGNGDPKGPPPSFPPFLPDNKVYYRDNKFRDRDRERERERERERDSRRRRRSRSRSFERKPDRSRDKERDRKRRR